jgi:hypothetical protein
MNTHSFARAAHWRGPSRVIGRLVPGLILAAAVMAVTSTAAHAGNSARVPAASAAARGLDSSLPAARAASPGCVAWTGLPPPSNATFARLVGVATLSPCDAWAVGFQSNQGGPVLTLIEHWNGAAWKRVASPNPGGANVSMLSSIAATSATNAWAAGSYCTDPTCSAAQHAFILHWNGKAWAQQAQLADQSVLTGVAATSATNAWAVGTMITPSNRSQALIEHWNGTAWKQVPSPRVGLDADLRGVAAASRTNAWAVGAYSSPGGGGHTLIEHWNGTAWKQVPSPSPGGASATSFLKGVTAVSGRVAWAVGERQVAPQGTTVGRTLILRWNGTAWKRVPSPNPNLDPTSAPDDTLNGVAATSATNAWAVGTQSGAPGETQPSATLIEHWNGTAWIRIRSPRGQPGSGADSSSLAGVAASSAHNMWAVGALFASGDNRVELPLALHCC